MNQEIQHRKYTSGIYETTDQPTLADLKTAGGRTRKGVCLCGMRVPTVTSAYAKPGNLIMGKYTMVAWHSPESALHDHYESYWQQVHPYAYEWWTNGANYPLHYSGRQLIIRGNPPKE